MIAHIYRCPECDSAFTVDHPDETVYADECPNCGYAEPDLVDQFKGFQIDD